jgi:chromobox protein 1
LEDYYKQIGGRNNIFESPKRAIQGRKRRKRSSPTPKSQRKGRPQRVNTDVTGTDWTPPSGLWDDEEVSIDACDNVGDGKLVVYLMWKNKRKTKHDASVIYQKCPQKVSNKTCANLMTANLADRKQMLRFYEKHVRFTGAES